MGKVMQKQLMEEGISSIVDLQFINSDLIKELANNLCRPSGSKKPFHFSITSQMKMLDTSNYVRHCVAMGRVVSPDHCRCKVIQNFACQWKALEKQRDGDQPTPPVVGKDLNMLRWSKAFGEFLMQKIGMHGAPLQCVIRKDAVPEGDLPALAKDQPHTEINGSVHSPQDDHFVPHDGHLVNLNFVNHAVL